MATQSSAILPKAQPYPESLKKGSVIFRVAVYGFEDGRSGIELEEWVVRTIQMPRGSKSSFGVKHSDVKPWIKKNVNLARRIKGTTWVNGAWAGKISSWNKESFRKGPVLPDGFYTTELKAFKYAVKDCEKSVGDCEQYKQEELDCKEIDQEAIEDWDLEIEQYKNQLRLAKSRLTRFRNKKATV